MPDCCLLCQRILSPPHFSLLFGSLFSSLGRSFSCGLLLLLRLLPLRLCPFSRRGFGFTGLHYHKNFAIDDFRKLVLNAMVWVAGAEIPEGGIETPKPNEADLKLNQDYAPRKK